jgi:hypothetical protein
MGLRASAKFDDRNIDMKTFDNVTGWHKNIISTSSNDIFGEVQQFFLTDLKNGMAVHIFL